MASSGRSDCGLSSVLPGVGPLVYGCMGLGGGWNSTAPGKADVALAHACVDAALEAGIKLFDHADIYTLGKAEQVFGQVLRERPGLRSQLYLQSKCGIRFADGHGPKRYDFSRDWITQSVDGILARLGSEYLDILLLHRPDPLMEPDELAGTFESLKLSGKVRHFGVSNMHAGQLAYLQSFLPVPLVANQLELSLARRAWVEEGVTAGSPAGLAHNFAPGTLEYCHQHDVQIQAWGSLCQGLYSGREIAGETPAVQATAALVADYAEHYQASREAIVLAWLLRHPARIQPVIGSTNAKRIHACAQASRVGLSREHWYALFEAARGGELP